MRNGPQFAFRLLTTAVTLTLMVALLIGLPELTYVTGSDSVWPGEYRVRLLEVLLSSEPTDPITCSEAPGIPACLRAELLDWSLFNKLSEDSGAMLVRNLAWMQFWGLAFLAIRVTNSVPAGRELMIEVGSSLSQWLPTAHVLGVVVAMAGAYFFNHI